MKDQSHLPLTIRKIWKHWHPTKSSCCIETLVHPQKCLTNQIHWKPDGSTFIFLQVSFGSGGQESIFEKWLQPKPNFKVGDLVLLADKNLTPTHWHPAKSFCCIEICVHPLKYSTNQIDSMPDGSTFLLPENIPSWGREDFKWKTNHAYLWWSVTYGSIDT